MKKMIFHFYRIMESNSFSNTVSAYYNKRDEKNVKTYFYTSKSDHFDLFTSLFITWLMNLMFDKNQGNQITIKKTILCKKHFRVMSQEEAADNRKRKHVGNF